MAIHKKGDAIIANNYCLVSVMGLFPKLYMGCLNNQITQEVKLGEWCTPIQAGFMKRHHRNDLIVVVNYLIDVAVGIK